MLVFAFGFGRSVFESRPAEEIVRIDLGEVAPETQIERIVTLSNRRSETLHVKSVIRDCACLAHALSRDTIPAGEAAALRVQIVSPSGPGSFRHTVTVYFDELRQPTFAIFEGRVSQLCSAVPERVELNEVFLGETHEADVAIRLSHPIVASECVCELNWEGAQILSGCGTFEGPEIHIRLAFTAMASMPWGQNSGELTIRQANRMERVVRIPCVAHVVSRWVMPEPCLMFGLVKPGTTIQREITVSARTAATTLAASNIAIAPQLDAGFSVEATDILDNRVKLSVNFKAEPEMLGQVRSGQIEVRNADLEGEQGLLAAIPVSAMVR
jgi:hypothetical protein